MPIPFTLRGPLPADYPVLAALISRTFGRSPTFVDCLVPLHWTSAGAAAYAARQESSVTSDPSSRVVLAVDPATGAIAGAAWWNVYAGGTDPGELADTRYVAEADWAAELADPPVPGGNPMGRKDVEQWAGFEAMGNGWSEEEKARERGEYAKFIVDTWYQRRREELRGAEGPVWILDVLATAPEYQRQGAGRQLVQWGLAQADQDGAEAWVEASTAGRRLYESQGFVFERELTVPLPRPHWGPSPKPGPLIMRRPRKGAGGKEEEEGEGRGA